jgi:hypothetical protein
VRDETVREVETPLLTINSPVGTSEIGNRTKRLNRFE